MLDWCVNYTDNTIEGIREQTRNMLKCLQDTLARLKEYALKMKMKMTTTAPQQRDSLRANLRASLSPALEQKSSRVLNVIDLQESANDLIDSIARRSHFVVELRDASVDSDLDRIEYKARKFVADPLSHHCLGNKRANLIDRLESIDVLNETILSKENVIENLKIQHEGALRKLKTRKRRLRDLFGSIEKLGSDIERMQDDMDEKDRDFETELKRLEDEEMNALNDTSLTEAARSKISQSIKSKSVQLTSAHSKVAGEFTDRMETCRIERLSQEDSLNKETLNEMYELELQMENATSSELLSLQKQKADLEGHLEDSSIQGVQVGSKTFYTDEFDRKFNYDPDGNKIMNGSDGSKFSMDKSGNWVKRTSGTGIFPDEDADDEDSSDGSDSFAYSSDEGKLTNGDCDYIKQAVGKSLIKGLVECALKRPADPIMFLSKFTANYRLNIQKQDIKTLELEPLLAERKRIQDERFAEAERLRLLEEARLLRLLESQDEMEGEYDDYYEQETVP